MSWLIKKIIKILIGVLIFAGAFTQMGGVYAGDLDDSAVASASSGGVPQSFGYTLTDLYNKVYQNTSAAPGSYSLNPAAAAASTMWSIDQIYNQFNIDATACNTTFASDVASGKVFFATSGTTRNINGGNWGPVTGTAVGKALPDTGQTTSYTTTFGEDHDYQFSSNQPSYTDNGNGTITDNRTGLMWVKDPTAAAVGGTYTWEGALTACEGLTYATYTDWRLPNVRELMSIVDYGKSTAPRINTVFVSQSSTYWSSTTYVPLTATAWYVVFDSGYVGYTNKPIAYYVRPVRLGQ